MRKGVTLCGDAQFHITLHYHRIMTILYILIGVVVGAAAVFIYYNNRDKRQETNQLLLQQQLRQEQKSIAELRQSSDAAIAENKEIQSQLTQMRIELERANTQLEAEKEHNTAEAQMRKEQFAEQLKTVQEQFSNLATRVLSETSLQLKSNNSESMESLTKPLRMNIEQLHKAIQDTTSESTRNIASLSQQLKSMTEQALRIDQTTSMLTNVIRGDNKTQGNWGERRLADLLDSQGMQRGIDYDIQQMIVDDKGNAVTHEETGRKMIPDAILHYPNNEDVVIDSKVSIQAYYDYSDTEDGTLRKKYAGDLVRSMRNQVSLLSRKDYGRYIQPPRHAVEFVVMYVPFDGALQLALSTDHGLWRDAFESNVLIASQQTLIPMLRMIQIAWREYRQGQNQKQIFTMADELLNRIGQFIEYFNKVGSDIEALQRDYQATYKKAYTGRQSIVQKANELKELGVKENKKHAIPRTEPDLLEGTD